MLAATMLFATSCQQDEVFVDGNEAVVQFQITTPEMATRAYSDGMTATNLQYAVYDKDGKQITEMFPGVGHGEKEIKGSTTVELKLAQGNTYHVLFWAAADGAPYNVDFVNHKLNVLNYTSASNDESRDAFYKWHEVTVNNNEPQRVELRRPFAQLNIGTGDMDDATAAGVTVATTSVTVSNVYTAMDFANGGVDEATKTTATFSLAPVPAADEKFPVENYDYLAMNYVLVPADKIVANEVELTYTGAAAAETRTFTSIPLQRNYRTNIYGDLLTKGVDFIVEIKPAYEEPNGNHLEKWDGVELSEPTYDDATKTYYISHAAELAYISALVNGTLDTDNVTRAAVPATSIDGCNFVMECDLDFGGNLFTPIKSARNITFDGQGHTIHNISYAPGVHYATMFEIVSGTFKDINMVNVKATEGATNRAGALLGYYTGGTVANVHVKDVEIKGFQKLGGLIAYITQDGGEEVLVKNCSVENVTIAASDNGDVYQAGGFLGYISSSAKTVLTIENCEVKGNIVINDTPELKEPDHFNFYSGGFIGSIGSTTDENKIVEINLNNCKVGTVTANPALSISPRGGELFGDCVTEGSNIGGRQPNLIYINGLRYIADGVCMNEQDEYVITKAEGMTWVATQVDNGKSFAGETIVLNTDIILPEGTNWNPIGDNREDDAAFSGTFDGQGHLISGAKISGDFCWDGTVYGSKEGWGLFSVLDGATVKNLKVDGAIFGSYTVISGVIAGYANNTTFENIDITNSKVAGYNWYTGGVVGWAQGECTFKGINLDNTVAVGSLWDSHGQNAGGIAGGVSASSKITIEDCNIACVLDVINDVTSNYKWYIYRVSGMIIGNTNTTETKYNEVVTATATNVTCKNVTVTYGDWMNYHYCEEYGNRGWGRVEESEYVGFGIPNEHTHSDGKEHYVCLPFDQLFGGSSNGSGHYPVKGLAEFPGVTVNYPDKYTCSVCGMQHNVE